MARHPFHVTLFAGESTREISYGLDRRGQVVRTEESDWDGPVHGRIERAELEVVEVVGAVAKLAISGGRQFLRLEEAEAIEGISHAIAAGKQPQDALDSALILSRG